MCECVYIHTELFFSLTLYVLYIFTHSVVLQHVRISLSYLEHMTIKHS